VSFATQHIRAKLMGLCTLLLLLSSTSVQAGGQATYRVTRGDNLSVIAARFGVRVKEIKQANSLTSDVIHVGQKLTLRDPLHMTRARDVRWAPPVSRPGQVLRPFGPYKVKGIIMPRTGTAVACPWGTTVHSPANGVVRHIGHMDGFGTLMIIEHGGGYASVLAPFDPAQIQVQVGDAITRGAILGPTAPVKKEFQEPYLHVELRKNDKSIKPDRLLK
jgi:septal ring factor EnvC (AmiA/AmiB activator)